MRNERGLTLVELLAVLALVAIIMTLIISVFINGAKASERSTTNQRLQQEANYIVESIRNEYLRLEDTVFELYVDKDNQSLIMDGRTISAGYEFQFLNDDNETIETIPIDRNESVKLEFTIFKGELDYKVKTVFSKLH